MTSRQFREDAVPRPLEMAAVVLCVIIFVFWLPVQGDHDVAVRILCFFLGAGSLAIFNDYRRRARKQIERTTSTHDTGETGDTN